MHDWSWHISLKHIRCGILLTLCLCGGCHSQYVSDDFEDGLQWDIFEEIVNACYSDNLGYVAIESTAGYNGSNGLCVAANSNLSDYSSHIISGYTPFSGVSGRWKYSLYAKLPADYAETSQIGPEFSVQNTRSAPDSSTYTSIAGIQHVASKYIAEKWNIWIETAQNVATWQHLNDSRWDIIPVLIVGHWYHHILEIDFEIDEYVSLTVVDLEPGATTSTYTANLVGLKIAAELRGWSSACVLTLEAENLYNNCGTAGPFQSKMYYDVISFFGVSDQPTGVPSSSPSGDPTGSPSAQPSGQPTEQPSAAPSISFTPTADPTPAPSGPAASSSSSTSDDAVIIGASSAAGFVLIVAIVAYFLGLCPCSAAAGGKLAAAGGTEMA
jgi:hypothetical protein